MLRPTLLLVAVLGFGAVQAPDARADLCFRYGSGGGTLVARKVALPAPDTCKPLALFESGGTAGSATGSICADRSGAIVIFHYDYDGCIGPAYQESATCRLQLHNGGLPTTGGACRGKANGSAFVDGSLVLRNCNVFVPQDIGGLCAASRAANRVAAPFSHPSGPN
ncbi:MAG: hypothetical protein U1E45_16005 [Geminicoccaceae bacterium]